MALKIIKDFVPTAPALKYDADARDLIEAYKEDTDVVGAIEVNILDADSDEATEAIIAREVRSFQAATLKQGYSARRREVRVHKDNTAADVLFTLALHTPRAPKADEAVEVAEPTAK